MFHSRCLFNIYYIYYLDTLCVVDIVDYFFLGLLPKCLITLACGSSSPWECLVMCIGLGLKSSIPPCELKKEEGMRLKLRVGNTTILLSPKAPCHPSN